MKNVKFASISDQLINTAIIMDMMFNTEMIVKDMKGGKEDMTEKRFELRLCNNGIYYVYENGTLTDIDFDKFNKESAYALIDEVNALYKEKEKLKIFLRAVNEELDLTIRDYDTLEEENKQLKAILKQFTGSKYNDKMGIN